MDIVDLHPCIQGEGKYAGIPHLLIRLSGCNLHCGFSESICDTPYASWFPEKGRYSMEDIRKIISENPNIKNTLITGGEPTLHPSDLKELVETVRAYNHHISLETNGTHFVEADYDFVSISPKLSNSVPALGMYSNKLSGEKIHITETQIREHNNRRISIETITRYIQKYAYQIKFVVSNQSDIKEVLSIQHRTNIPSSHIWLMPEGISDKQLNERRAWLSDICIEYGFNYTDRLHIIIHGDKREA